MVPSAYQIRFSVTTPQTILAFPLHQDSISISRSNSMLCEVKTYSTGLAWLSVYQPADPLT